ncbi:hypothetical protein AB0H12_41750 [Actinosynnema sp. NPDC023794]
MPKSLKQAVMAILLGASACLVMTPAPAQAETVKTVCVDNGKTGTVCSKVYRTGTFVSKVFATHEYYPDSAIRQDLCGGAWNMDPATVYMTFTLTGTLNSGAAYALRGTGRCDVDGVYGWPAKVEYRTFVVDRTFRAGSSLCLRSTYGSAADDGSRRACVQL